MLPAWKRAFAALIGPTALAAWGCYEAPPPEQYPDDLGTEDKRLMPLPTQEYSGKILDGQATIVGLEDTAAARSAQSQTAAPQTPSAGPGSGASKWGRILSRAVSPSEAAPPAAPAGRGGGPASAEDQAAISDLLQQARGIDPQRLGEFLVADQKTALTTVLPAMESALEMAQYIRDDLATDAPQTAEAASTLARILESQFSLDAALEQGPGPIQMADPDRAVVVAGGAQLVLERSGGSWLIRLPALPTGPAADEFANLLRDLGSAMESVADELEQDNLDDAAALARMQTAVQTFQTRSAALLTPGR
jgi:hypothetical protein